MKTMISAGLILAIILTVGLWFDRSLTEVCDNYKQALGECHARASQGDWEKCLQLLTQIEKDWDKKRAIFASFTHHSRLDTIQAALMRTSAAAREEDKPLFALEFRSLIEAISSLSESDKPNLANIF